MAKPLFLYFAATTTTILSLILIAASITTTTTTLYAYAQEEEEEENEDKKDKDKDKKDEDKDSKDEDKEEEKSESNNNDDATTIQIIQDQLTPNTTTTIQQQEEQQIPEPTIPIVQVPQQKEEEFNATCKCMTTSLTPSEEPKKPIPQPPQNNQEEQKIIPITKADIIDSKSFGQVTDPAYTSYYTVPNLLDNIINDVSFWSQAGKSSFYIKLDNALDNYQVCSTELNIHNPKNTPYLLDVGVSKNYTGVIDQMTERIQFDKCVKNMDEIYMTFENPSGSYISIAEIKLFGSKLTTTGAIIPPTLEPETIIPTIPTTENATKINIENSNAEVDIKNSTITFKFDPLTATFVGSK